jgi:hypothetical protein
VYPDLRRCEGIKTMFVLFKTDRCFNGLIPGGIIPRNAVLPSRPYYRINFLGFWTQFAMKGSNFRSLDVLGEYVREDSFLVRILLTQLS